MVNLEVYASLNQLWKAKLFMYKGNDWARVTRQRINQLLTSTLSLELLYKATINTMKNDISGAHITLHLTPLNVSVLILHDYIVFNSWISFILL